MNIDQIKSKIESSEYDFLRTNEHLVSFGKKNTYTLSNGSI